jgi:hypothetical protein
MSTGYVIAGQCLAFTSSQAAAYHCQADYPVQAVTSAGSVVAWSCNGVGSSFAASYTLNLYKAVDNTTPAGPYSTSRQSPTCVIEDWPNSFGSMTINDSLLIGPAVVAVWLVALAARSVRATLSSDVNNDV